MGYSTQLTEPSQRQLLLLGASSFVGNCLFQKIGVDCAVGTFFRNSRTELEYFDSVRMDVNDLIGIDDNFGHAVILLGDSDPDSCVNDVAKSNALNVVSIIEIIDVLIDKDITPVFISSQFVFDGLKGAYNEEDPVNPILVYGKQKVAVEQYLREQTKNHLILRLPKVYGTSPGDGTLFTSWVDNIRSGMRQITCAEDQIFSPIVVDDVADAILATIEAGCIGTYHVSGPESYTRIEMLMILLSKLDRIGNFDIQLEPCSINDFDLPERRPIDVSMISDKLVRELGLQLKPLNESCDQIISNYFPSRAEKKRIIQ